MSANDTDTASVPEPVPGVRKSAVIRLHPVPDPDAWRDAVLPEPAAPKPKEQETDA